MALEHPELVGAVLAAGQGTRLWPLTRHRPKPLVPVAGRPLLAAALEALRALGIRQIGVNAFHLPEQVVAAFAGDPQVSVIVEESLEGTGGGIRGIAAALPATTLVVINGDALFGFDLAPCLAAHRASGALGTLVLREVPPEAPFGRVGIDEDGRLHRIAEVEGPDAAAYEGPGSGGGCPPEPGGTKSLKFGAFTGVQIIEPALVAAIPAGPGDILRTAWRTHLMQRAPLFGHFVPAESAWFDVGSPDRYLEAHRAVLAGQLPAVHLPPADDSGRRIAPTARIHPTARLVGPCAVLAGAVVEAGAVVGPWAFVDADACVEAGVEVVDSVLWPATRATRGLCGAIVLPDQVVLVGESENRPVESERRTGASS